MTNASRSTRWKIGVPVAALLVGLTGGFAAAPAAAAPGDADPGSDDAPDRIVYVDHPAPQPPNDRVTQVGDAYMVEDSEFPLVPKPGETVRVVYTDAVTDVTTEDSLRSEGSVGGVASAASCTRSITTYTPYLGPHGLRVTAEGRISSGCTSGSTLNIYIQSSILTHGSGSVYVPNTGTTWGKTIQGDSCWGSASNNYRGFAQFGGLGGTASAYVSLPCSF